MGWRIDASRGPEPSPALLNPSQPAEDIKTQGLTASPVLSMSWGQAQGIMAFNKLADMANKRQSKLF